MHDVDGASDAASGTPPFVVQGTPGASHETVGTIDDVSCEFSPEVFPPWLFGGAFRSYATTEETDLPYYPVSSAAVFVVSDAGLVLVDGLSYGWDLPGGQPDGDESPVDAAMRGLGELTGLQLAVADTHLIGYAEVEYEGCDGRFAPLSLMTFHVAQADPVELSRSDGGDVADDVAAWVKFDDVVSVAAGKVWLAYFTEFVAAHLPAAA